MLPGTEPRVSKVESIEQQLGHSRPSLYPPARAPQGGGVGS